tara:strand:- start:180 stop:332 length:153 start_codon:yes stop_codon:yes gene_type:complete
MNYESNEIEIKILEDLIAAEEVTAEKLTKRLNQVNKRVAQHKTSLHKLKG